jgi:predicted TIM-barrel fold metal-dependent hydrolase
MPVIDAQVHAYEHNHPGRPWVGKLHGPDSATGDEMVAAMDAVGVDGAIFVSSLAFYGYDASYALEVYAKHPDRYRLVKPVDTTAPELEENVADWASKKGTVGIRVVSRDDVSSDPADPGINRALAAAAKHSMAVNILCWGRLEQAMGLAARNPDTQIVIDHLGLAQPFEPPLRRSHGRTFRRCWRLLPTLTSPSRSAELARYPTSHSPTTTSGTRSPESSMPTGSTAACGGRTGPGRLAF